MKTSIYVITLLVSLHVNGQNFATVENGRLKIEVWMPKTSGVINANANNENQIDLSFFGDFHDTAVIFLNNKQIYRGYLNTDRRRNKRVISLVLAVDPGAKSNLLCINLMSSKECMLAYIETKYKNIEVQKFRKWELYYSDYVSVPE